MEWRVLVRTWLTLVVGVFLAAGTSRGIGYQDGGSLLVAALLLSVLNLFLKPLLLLLSLPFIVLTFGLGVWLINALLFLLASALVPGFEVAGFLPALWGALVLSASLLLANAMFGEPGRVRSRTRIRVHRGPAPHRRPSGEAVDRRPRGSLADDDVIDVDSTED